MNKNTDSGDNLSPTNTPKTLNAVTNEPKITKWGTPSFTFDFTPFGRSLFQNLILTASGYILKGKDKKEKEPIPLKYIWKRTKQETTIVIKDITSNSYIPTAEDICYNIEVEAIPIESDIYGTERAFASYGPIYLDLDMKHTLEILLSSENAKFSCFLYNSETQEKKTDKEYIVNINSSGIGLKMADYEKSIELEFTAFMPGNPRIILHPYDTKRLIIEFYEYEINDDSNFNSSPIDKYIVLQTKVKGRYDLITESKQRREIIYLLTQCHVIDDQIKNNKLFSYLNYSSLPSEMKLGVTDMMSEIKTLKEENYIFSKNIGIREKEINKLKNEMRSLEEDFQITLTSINQSVYGIADDIGTGNNVSSTNTSKGSSNNISDKSYNELKLKHDELRETYSKLSSKEKGSSEKNREFLTEIEILKNNINEQKNELKILHDRLTEKTAEFNGLTKSLKVIEDFNSKLKKEVDNLKLENTKLEKIKTEMEDLKTKFGNIDEIQKVKTQLEEDKKKYQKIDFENNSLIQQRDKLAKQNTTTLKEFEKMKLSQDKFNETLNAEKELSSNLQNKLSIMEAKFGKCFDEKVEIERSLKKKQADFDVLDVKYIGVKQIYDDLYLQSMNDNSIKISKEDYEEYDNLKKKEDENEATVMQLSTNCHAKDLEIKNLKLQLKQLQEK